MTFRYCSIPGCTDQARSRGWCPKHYARWLRRGGDPAISATNQGMPEVARFWSKVDKSGDCWLWTGSTARGGYPGFFVMRDGIERNVMAHRYAYELLVGPIPDGLQLDHLCRIRHCVNPTHLEPVTPRENTIRGNTFQRKNWLKTHCKRGHPFDEANTYRIPPNAKLPNGGRACRTCEREKARRLKAARLASTAP
jgi:hypothetical protein